MTRAFIAYDFEMREDLRGLLQEARKQAVDKNLNLNVDFPGEDRFEQGEIWRTKVKNGIEQADRVVAYVDLPNANVGFEIGYALGLGKKVALARLKDKKPDWLSLPPFKTFPCDQVTASEDLIALLSLGETKLLSVDPRIKAGKQLLLLCPSEKNGRDYAPRITDKYAVKPLGSGWTANDIPNKLKDIGHVIWIILPQLDDERERDGKENAALSVVAGLAKGIDLHTFVFRHKTARKVVDVEIQEQVFTTPSELMALIEARMPELHANLRREEVAAVGLGGSVMYTTNTLDGSTHSGLTPEHVRVIGWKGIESNELYPRLHQQYKDDRKQLSLAFLTTQMSLENLPNLEYYQHGIKNLRFDAVYMDYEFADRYEKLRLIQNLEGSEEIQKWFHSYSPRSEGAPRMAGSVRVLSSSEEEGSLASRCVPVQFGFNEILMNRSGNLGEELSKKLKKHYRLKRKITELKGIIETKKPNDIDREESENELRLITEKFDALWSYSDFDLGEVLADKTTTVAIWHWYLPSLLHFLLSAQVRANVSTVDMNVLTLSKCLRDDNGWSTTVLEEHIEQLCKRLGEDQSSRRVRIRICHSMSQIEDALFDPLFRAGIVIGLGSSVLWSPARFAAVEPIVPRQGTFVWMNCAAVLRDGDRENATNIIRHWLDDDTQREMFIAGSRELRPTGSEPSSSPGYVGLPANQKILTEILEAYKEYPAVQTFGRLFGKDDPTRTEQIIRDGRVACRVLPPKVWGNWLHLWETFREELESRQSRRRHYRSV